MREGNEEFTRDFKAGFEKLGWTEFEVADALRVSRPTIAWWLVGKHLPHPAMRPLVLNWIRNAAPSVSTSSDVHSGDHQGVEDNSST